MNWSRFVVAWIHPRKRRPAGFYNLPPVSRLPFAYFGGPNRRKSPAVFENISVFRRLRPETWFDRDCRVRAAVMPGIRLSIFSKKEPGIETRLRGDHAQTMS
jgi:hypothetical protein